MPTIPQINVTKEHKDQFRLDYAQYILMWRKLHPHKPAKETPTHSDFIKECMDSYKRELKRFRPTR